jgi:hypothetical protein
MNIDLVPFATPNFVILKIKGGPSLSLAEIDAEDLSELCYQFREDIFKKAGKADPEILQ